MQTRHLGYFIWNSCSFV